MTWGSRGRRQASVIACQAVVSVWMISGAHYSIMMDEELDFSDNEHEAALQALIKRGAVEIVLNENGYRELRLTKIGEGYAQWVFDNWGDPLPATLLASNRKAERSNVLRVACLISLRRSKQKGQQVFLDP